MSETKHTPLPWRIKPCLNGGMILLRGDGTHGSHPQDRLQIVPAEDAEFIVRACNSFDDLLAACNAVIKRWGSGLNGVSTPENNNLLVALCDAANKAEGRS